MKHPSENKSLFHFRDPMAIERTRVALRVAHGLQVALGLLFVLSSSALAGDRYAFLVAVREYDKNELTNLQFTENDITKLARTLKGAGYSSQNVVLMTQSVGAQKPRFIPVAENIRSELSLLVRELKSDDSIVIGFAGHGVQFKGEKNAYFCPANARLADRDTLISLEDVYQMLDACAARTKVLFVDACRNDPLSNRARSAREVELEPTGRRVAPVPPSGIAALFSCSATEQSYEDPELKQGVFFHYVIDGLSGKGDLDNDGDVSLAELEQHVTKSVQRYVRIELGKAQTPERRGEARGLISLAKVSVRTSPDGKELPAYLGLNVRRPTQEQAQRANLPRITGAFTIGVFPNSPAYEAGFQVGDTILRVDEEWIDKYQDLASHLAKRKIGDEITVLLVRDGKRQPITVALDAYPGDVAMAGVFRALAEEGHAYAEARMGFLYRDGVGVEKDDKQAFEWFRKGADQGDHTAQTALAEFYLAGRVVEKNVKEAEAWFLKAAEQEDVLAQTQLGVLYSNGKDIPVDHAASLKWYTRAAELGDAYAQARVARIYAKGIGVEKNARTAFEWYDRAAKQGLADGYYGLGIAYRNGEGVEKDPKKAFEYVQLAAKQGSVQAKACVGVLHLFGDGTPKDPVTALKWLHEAANEGNADAYIELGAMYHRGNGVAKDDQLSVKYFRQAADQGLALGQFSMGVIYRDGIGVTKDMNEALTWFRRGAEQGDAQCLNEMGRAYEHGRGVEIDYAKALKYYLEAANKENAAAQGNLGLLIANGKGVQRDYEAALGWLKAAAKQNLPDAGYYIAVMYQNGWVQMDRTEAETWLQRAAALGSAKAKQALRDAGIQVKSGD
jgi:TPR repeat protein